MVAVAALQSAVVLRVAIDAVVEVGRYAVRRIVGATAATHRADLGACHHLYLRRDADGAVQNSAEHVERDGVPLRRPLPVSAGIAVDGRSAALRGTLAPDELRPVDDGLACQHDVLRHRNSPRCTHEVAGTNGVLCVAILHIGFHTVLYPSARIETDAVAASEAAEPCSETVALVEMEILLLCVFLETKEMFRAAAQQGIDIGVTLHIGQRHLVGIMVGVGKADSQIAAVGLGKLQQLCEELQAGVEGHAALRVEAPILFGKVESQEVGVLLVVFLVSRHILRGVRHTARCAAGTLYHRPHAVLGAHLHPRVVDGRAVGRLLVARRCGNVEDDEGAHILRHHIDDFLRVGIVPHVDMDDPCRLFR